MGRPLNLPRWRPTPVSLIAGALVLAGFLLADVSWWFILLTGLGTFGPGLLRELGLLRDKDELQRHAAYRAGYHAFLAAGLVGFLVIARVRTAGHPFKDPEELGTLFVALLWFTWMFSSLIGYFGAPRTARTILLAFGCGWLLFNIAGNLHSPVGMLMQVLVTTAPFFGLAWFAGRWPRVAGALLIAAAIAFFYFFHFFRRQFGAVTDAVTVVLFIGPLLGSGVALLGARGERDAIA